MADVCGLVLTAVYNQLSGPVGFNRQYASVQASYSDLTDGQVPDFTVDWSGDSQNFAYGTVPPDLIEESSSLAYPMLTLSADRGSSYQPGSGQRLHFMQFTGRVAFRIEVHLDWESVGVRDFETWPNAVINAMYAALQVPNAQQPLPPGWNGAQLIYSYDLNFGKGPILAAGRNWRRTIAFTGTFEVNIP